MLQDADTPVYHFPMHYFSNNNGSSSSADSKQSHDNSGSNSNALFIPVIAPLSSMHPSVIAPIAVQITSKLQPKKAKRDRSQDSLEAIEAWERERALQNAHRHAHLREEREATNARV